MPNLQEPQQAATGEPAFHRGLGLFDSVMIVVGVMIGSGIFIVSAEMSRQIGSAGWLLAAWGVTGVLTVSGALTYGELAAMMPQAGGMYIYLREAFSPLWGFLYGWTLWTVIQTGTIAAVAIAFARFAGVLFSSVSESKYLIAPRHISSHYAVSLSTAQALAIGVIVVLTVTNSCGLNYGKVDPKHLHDCKGGSAGGPHRSGTDGGRQPGGAPREFRSRVDGATCGFTGARPGCDHGMPACLSPSAFRKRVLCSRPIHGMTSRLSPPR